LFFFFFFFFLFSFLCEGGLRGQEERGEAGVFLPFFVVFLFFFGKIFSLKVRGKFLGADVFFFFFILFFVFLFFSVFFFFFFFFFWGGLFLFFFFLFFFLDFFFFFFLAFFYFFFFRDGGRLWFFLGGDFFFFFFLQAVRKLRRGCRWTLTSTSRRRMLRWAGVGPSGWRQDDDLAHDRRAAMCRSDDGFASAAASDHLCRTVATRHRHCVSGSYGLYAKEEKKKKKKRKNKNTRKKKK